MRFRIVLLGIFFLVLTASIGLFVYFFLNSGGAGLTRVTWNYLIPKISDRKYNWQDFTDRGPDQKISGFYSGSSGDSFYLWTLSGRKEFKNKPGTSIYMFTDFCAAIRNLDTNPEATAGAAVKTQVTGVFSVWRWQMRKEYLVTVLRLQDETDKNLVDKVWSESGKYKIIGQLTKEQCN